MLVNFLVIPFAVAQVFLVTGSLADCPFGWSTVKDCCTEKEQQNCWKPADCMNEGIKAGVVYACKNGDTCCSEDKVLNKDDVIRTERGNGKRLEGCPTVLKIDLGVCDVNCKAQCVNGHCCTREDKSQTDVKGTVTETGEKKNLPNTNVEVKPEESNGQLHDVTNTNTSPVERSTSKHDSTNKSPEGSTSNEQGNGQTGLSAKFHAGNINNPDFKDHKENYDELVAELKKQNENNEETDQKDVSTEKGKTDDGKQNVENPST